MKKDEFVEISNCVFCSGDPRGGIIFMSKIICKDCHRRLWRQWQNTQIEDLSPVDPITEADNNEDEI